MEGRIPVRHDAGSADAEHRAELDFGAPVHGKPPFAFSHAFGTMNCPADVAQASSPASAPGVPPGVRAGGETPPQLAAGTAALRGSWRACTTLMPRMGAMNPPLTP